MVFHQEIIRCEAGEAGVQTVGQWLQKCAAHLIAKIQPNSDINMQQTFRVHVSRAGPIPSASFHPQSVVLWIILLLHSFT